MLWWILTLSLTANIARWHQEPFVEGKTTTSQCPSGWIKFRTSCYKLFTERVDHEIATNECKKHSAELAIIHSKEVHMFLQGLLEDSIYIGLDDLIKEGTFIWRDGSSMDYSRFAKGQPNNYGGKKHCVEMRREFGYFWNDIPCSFKRQFICKNAATHHGEPFVVEGEKTISIPTPTPGCPSGWKQFLSSCYKLFTKGVIYETATKECKKHGGKLTIVHRKEDHMFLQGLLEYSTYIGLDDLKKEGTFIFQDGSSMDYSRFAKGQPNNYGGKQHCVEMRRSFGYFWNDITCFLKRRFICELQKSDAA